MQVFTNFNSKTATVPVTYLYNFQNIEFVDENFSKLLDLNDNRPFIFLVFNTIEGGVKLSKKLEEILLYRIQKRLPIKIIFDTMDRRLLDFEIQKIESYFAPLGINIEKDLLIIHSSWGFPHQETVNSFSYDQLALDGYYWYNTKPGKFTNLPLTQRPVLANLIVSKLTQKASRCGLVYEFYRQNLLPKCILSISGTVNEFARHIDDDNFLREIDQRIDSIGITNPISCEEGLTNIEFSCETSNRTIFNNSILSCVHETAFCDMKSNRWFSYTITEKTYRSIINKTPFIVFGCRGNYDTIEKLGFNNFGSLIDLNFDKIENCKDKIRAYTRRVSDFLVNAPNQIEALQEICNHNFDVFMKTATDTNNYYQKRITDFINISNY